MPATIQKILKPTKYRAVDTAPNNLYSSNLANNFENVSFDNFSFVDGVLTLEATGSDVENVAITNPVDVTAGDEFLVSFTISSGGGSGVYFKLAPNDDLNSADFTSAALANGTHSFTMSSSSLTDSTSYFGFRSNDAHNGTLVIRDISIQKIGNNGNNHGQIYSGRALEFDGTSDYLDTGMAFSETNCTVAVWAYIDDLGATADIICARDSDDEGVLIRANSVEQILFKVGDGSTTNIITSSKSYKNTWIRIVGTYDGSTQRLYINGVEDGSASISITIPSVTSNVFIGARSFTSQTNIFSGKLSDVQLWNATWSASDALYDYLNPESLALNNGGTSLTEYNLKLWYPMQDGHRGTSTQVVDGTNVASYIFDGANTGLGPELYTTANILSTTNETNAMTGITVKEGGQTVSGTIISDTFTGNYALDLNCTENEDGFYIDLNDYCIDGKQYAIKVIAKSGDASLKGGFFRIADGTNLSSTNAVPDYKSYVNSETHTDYQTYTIYFTHQTDGSASDNPATLTRYFGFRETSAQNTVRLIVDSISIRAIGEKHNATTEFLGEDLFDANVGDYSDSTGAWVAETGNSVDNNDSALRITYGGNDDGARLNLDDDADLKEDLVIGRTYELAFEYKITASASNVLMQINKGNTSFENIQLNHQTSFTAKTKKFVCLGATPSIKFNNLDTGDVLHLKNFTLKEVGIATGWTEADKQPDIPQTALQSYNQLVFYDGNDNYHQTSSDITLGDNTSISFWAYINEGSTSDSFGLIRAGTYGDQNFRIIAQTDQIVVATFNEDESTTTETHNFSTTVELGKWHHIAAYIPRQAGDSVILYHNGVKLTTDTMARDMKVEAHNWRIGLAFGITHQYLQGAITEISYFNAQLTDKEFWELYNDRKPLNALNHSKASQLVHYWRNEGIGDWSDNKGSNTLNAYGSPEETLLLPAGVDASRDTQGLIMNRQKTTNTLNLPIIGFHSGGNILGSSDIEVPSNTITDYTSTDFSFDCWINSAITGEAMFIATHQEATNTGEGWHLRRTSANTLNFTVHDHDGDGVTTGANATLSANRWYHVVCCWDSSASKKLLYIDGELKQIETGSNIGTITPDATLHIGNRRDNTSQEWVGNIDDVKIYNRLLSDGGVSSGVSDSNNLSLAAGGEIKRNYNAGKRSHR